MLVLSKRIGVNIVDLSNIKSFHQGMTAASKRKTHGNEDFYYNAQFLPKNVLATFDANYRVRYE
jgi:hypothetical protein